MTNKPGRRPIMITYAGQTRTLGEWAELAGVTKHALYQRLAFGWSMAEAMKSRPPRRRKLYEHDGKCMTVHGWAELSGIAYSTLFRRLKLGMTIGEAITFPRGKPWPGRGVVGVLAGVSGTGAGSTA